jgi:hypothetical protein
MEKQHYAQAQLVVYYVIKFFTARFFVLSGNYLFQRHATTVIASVMGSYILCCVVVNVLAILGTSVFNFNAQWRAYLSALSGMGYVVNSCVGFFIYAFTLFSFVKSYCICMLMFVLLINGCPQKERYGCTRIKRFSQTGSASG